MKEVKHIPLPAVIILIIVFIFNLINPEPIKEYYITTTGLNVRTGAGNKFAISFTLDIGEKVYVVSKKRGWYKILYSNRTGYVHPRYLTRYDPDIENKNPLISKKNKQILTYFLIGIFVIITIPFLFKYYKKNKDRKLLLKVTHSNRGTHSEKDLILRLLKSGISECHIFHDLYVIKSDSSFSQVDLVVITDVGIIVFEVKDYGGWIYGNGNQSQWTQVLAYGKQKYLFQNPIIQNNNHILNLKRQLVQFGNLPFYSIIVFYGDSVLKNLNFIPKETYIVKSTRVFEAMETILDNNVLIEYTAKEELLRNLKTIALLGENRNIQDQHVDNVRNLLGKSRIFD